MSIMDDWVWGLAAVMAGAAGGWLLIGRSTPKESPPSPADDAFATASLPNRAALPVIEPIEDRIAAQLSELDRLIDAADEEIARLEAALASSSPNLAFDRPLAADEQQRTFAMHEAGFNVVEIAECLDVLPLRVRQALDEWRLPGRNAA
jgi:hypothetical protein